MSRDCPCPLMGQAVNGLPISIASSSIEKIFNQVWPAVTLSSGSECVYAAFSLNGGLSLL